MAKDFNPGSFRHRISFLNPPKGKDKYGELSDEWTHFKAVMASKEPILGNQLFAAMTTDTKIEVKFKTRYISGVTDEMQIKHGDDTYEIISAIDVDAAHKELLCYCRLVR